MQINFLCLFESFCISSWKCWKMLSDYLLSFCNIASNQMISHYHQYKMLFHLQIEKEPHFLHSPSPADFIILHSPKKRILNQWQKYLCRNFCRWSEIYSLKIHHINALDETFNKYIFRKQLENTKMLPLRELKVTSLAPFKC